MNPRGSVSRGRSDGTVNRRRVLTLTVSALAMALASACGGGSGKAITVVIAEYSKDHTKPFWQGAGRAVHQADRREGRSPGHRLELDRSAGQHDDPEQPAPRRPEPQLVLQLRQGRAALPGGRRPVAEDEGRLPRAVRSAAASTRASSTGFRSCRARARSSTTRICSPRPGSPGRPRPGTSSSQAAGKIQTWPARSATRCRWGRRKPRPSGRSGCGTTAATGRRATRGRSTATRTSRRCRSWPTSPTSTRSPR